MSRRLDMRDLRGHPLVRRVRGVARRAGLWAIGHFLEESLQCSPEPPTL